MFRTILIHDLFFVCLQPGDDYQNTESHFESRPQQTETTPTSTQNEYRKGSHNLLGFCCQLTNRFNEAPGSSTGLERHDLTEDFIQQHATPIGKLLSFV